MAIHTLASLKLRGLRLPDREVVRKALAPTDERCPNCKKHRNYADFIYLVLPDCAVCECCCYHCLSSTDTAGSLGVGQCLLASERYVDNIVSQCVLDKMLLIELHRKRDIPVRQWVELGIADVIGRNWGEGCTGRWARTISPGGVPFDTTLPCCGENKPKRNRYFTRNGLLCMPCLGSLSSEEVDPRRLSAKLRPEIKQRQRLICEGVRHAIWLASLERYLPGMPQPGDFSERNPPWGIDWIDWLRERVETTDHWEDRPLAAHKRYRFV